MQNTEHPPTTVLISCRCVMWVTMSVRVIMLPLQGLAAAAASGAVTVSTLLQCSAVCGCGLDTVPVPGPNGDAAHDAQLQQRIAAVLMDVCALAFRCAEGVSVVTANGGKAHNMFAASAVSLLVLAESG